MNKMLQSLKLLPAILCTKFPGFAFSVLHKYLKHLFHEMKYSLYDTIMRSCPARGRVRLLGRIKKGLKVYNEKCKAKPKTRNTSVL